jgi:hypothetical protein
MKIRGNTITVQQISLKLKGGIMKGTLDMAKNILKGIPTPTENDHATNKEYVDYWVNKKVTDGTKTAKDYADSLTFHRKVTLTASGWVGDKAPYTQTIEVDGITKDDEPHYGPVYDADMNIRQAQKEAFNEVNDLDTADGSVTFTCDEDKPLVDLQIQLEVNR